MKVTYTALDGTKFNNEKDCREHDAKPHAFLVSDMYHLNLIIFLDEKKAIEYTENRKDKHVTSYYVKRVVVDISSSEQTVHSGITNNKESPKSFWNLFRRGK